MSIYGSSHRLAEVLAKTQQHWESRRLAETRSGGARSRLAVTIAISRQAGALGDSISQAIGQHLGWPVYDHELVQLVAEGMKVRTSLLDALDERRISWIRECMEALGSGPNVTQTAYLHRLIETLLALAAHGECVIVGRGAPLVLPVATTLRVRLIAPKEHRIAVIQERRKLTQKEAARWVETTDRERSAFLQDHFDADPADPKYCDLVVNSARFEVAECAEIVVAALRRLQDDPVAQETSHAGRSAVSDPEFSPRRAMLR